MMKPGDVTFNRRTFWKALHVQTCFVQVMFIHAVNVYFYSIHYFKSVLQNIMTMFRISSCLSR